MGDFSVADPDGKFAVPVRLDVSPKEVGRRYVGTCGPFLLSGVGAVRQFLHGRRKTIVNGLPVLLILTR